MSGSTHNIALTSAMMDDLEVRCESCGHITEAVYLTGGPTEDGDGTYWCPHCEANEDAITILVPKEEK